MPRVDRLAGPLLILLLLLSASPAARPGPGRRDRGLLPRHARPDAGSIPRPRPPRSRPSACSTRSTTRWCVRCRARRWGRASRSRGPRAPTGSSTSSGCAAASSSTTATRSPPTTSSGASSATRARGPASSGRACGRSRSSTRSSIRFHLKEPWPDFMTFYGTTATAAGIVLPRKYVEQVGADGFRQRPVGAGPYKFVSQRPGIDITFEAFPGYWRHVPYVKRLVMKSVPDSTTRADHAQERRDRLRAVPRRARGGGGHPRSALPARGHAPRLDLLDRVRRPVGSQVALGRPAAAPGRQPRARPQGHERGGLPRPLPARRASSCRA